VVREVLAVPNYTYL
jgi:hypothetical protein